MKYTNQIHLDNFNVDKNKQFLELLYNDEEIVRKNKIFEKVDSSVSREKDYEMTLDNFLNLMDSKTFINLQLGSPRESDIVYCARFVQYPVGVEKFVFIEFPYNDNNFNVVSKLYAEAFGNELVDEPIS